MNNENRVLKYTEFTKVRNIIFEMTNACNMRCTYCFEENAHSKSNIGMISWEVIQNTLDSVIIDENESYMITFFGGEPLLNKALIFRAISYSKTISRNLNSYVSFNMVTNAICLDSTTIAKLNAENVYIFVSFDGDRSSQDKYRMLKDGGSSYQLVLHNLKELIQSRKSLFCKDNMAVRMTITKDGIPHLVERYRFLCQLGCPKITFALVSASEEKPYAISVSDFPLLRQAYQELAELFIEEVQQGVIRNRFFQSLVKKITSGSHCHFFCDCGNRYLAAGYDGNLYPCEGFFGLEEFVVGNILKNSHDCAFPIIECVENNVSCKRCWARYLCGGGCYHESLMRTGNINKKDSVICETYRIAAETALQIYDELNHRGLLSQFAEISEEQVLDNAIPVFRHTSCKKCHSLLYSVTPNESILIELDELSERIVLLCDGMHSVSQITTALLDIYDCDISELYRDVCHFLNDLYDKNVIYFINNS